MIFLAKFSRKQHFMNQVRYTSQSRQREVKGFTHYDNDSILCLSIITEYPLETTNSVIRAAKSKIRDSPFMIWWSFSPFSMIAYHQTGILASLTSAPLTSGEGRFNLTATQYF
jgi:hypothetical protein